MKATQLRIGNFILFNTEINSEPFITQYEIASINCDDTIRFKSEMVEHENYCNGTIGCYSIKRISPIPLTEEWLIKFGFEKNNKDYLLNNVLIFDYTYLGTGDNHHIGFMFKWGNYINEGKDIVIQYVHQLQNLYFALTGEELELKSPKV